MSGISITVRQDESFENVLRRFRKQVEKAGILRETRRRMQYEKPSVRRKRKALAARKRSRKRMSRSGRSS